MTAAADANANAALQTQLQQPPATHPANFRSCLNYLSADW